MVSFVSPMGLCLLTRPVQSSRVLERTNVVVLANIGNIKESAETHRIIRQVNNSYGVVHTRVECFTKSQINSHSLK